MTSSSPTHEENEFSAALSEAMRRRRLTLQNIEARLRAAGTPVSTATLSYWQTGRTIPTRTGSLRAVESLEEILQVSPGALLGTLPGVERAAWQPSSVLPRPEGPTATLERMGLSFDMPTHTHLLVDTIHLTAGASTERQVTRQVVEATASGVQDFPMVFTAADDYPTLPELRALRGCTVVDLVELPQARAIVARMRWPHPLTTGELVGFEYEVLWHRPASEEGNQTRLLAKPVGLLCFEVAFAGTNPVAASYVRARHDDSDDEEHVAIPCDDIGELQYSVRSAAPGLHGLEWTTGVASTAGSSR